MKAPAESRDEAQLIASILAGDTQLYHQLIRPYERARIHDGPFVHEE